VGPVPVSQNYFSDVSVDPVLREKFDRLPAAATTCVIHFTPRSGSTLLTDLLSATGRLGRANEVFNPGFIPKIAQSLQATDMASYLHLLPRRLSTKGVFSLEVTAHHIMAVFGYYEAFHQLYGSAPSVWLIRQDIVAQAVSLAKMVTTNVSHFRHQDNSAMDPRDEAFSYDGELIKKWLLHIRAAETASEKWFAEFGVAPLRMSYEQTTALTPDQIVTVMSRYLRLPDLPPLEVSSAYRKLGNAQNVHFSERFRRDYAAFVQDLDKDRAGMLRQLHPIADMARTAGT